MTPEVRFEPVFLATRQDKEPARLVFADDRIVAVLVPVSADDDVEGVGGWYLLVGFGRCEAEGLMFETLAAAEGWVRDQLGAADVQARPDAALPEESRASRRAEEAAPPRSLRILVVEDDGLQALELETQLEALGHSVVALAASGPGAVEAAERHRPDLVLMDVRLANGTNGIDAAAEIQRRLGILSIFMTAHSDAQTRLRLERVRPLELLSKPVSAAAVAAALRRAAEPLTDEEPGPP